MVINTKYTASLLIILMTLLSCSKENKSEIHFLNNSNKSAHSSKPVEFEDLFEPEFEFLFSGTDSEPLYSVRDFLAFNNTYYVIDNKNYKVLGFNGQGEKVILWGAEGKGPGEFLSPELLIPGSDSTIYVVDGHGNFRVQQFSMNG